jgi:hypothetical protein
MCKKSKNGNYFLFGKTFKKLEKTHKKNKGMVSNFTYSNFL